MNCPIAYLNPTLLTVSHMSMSSSQNFKLFFMLSEMACKVRKCHNNGTWVIIAAVYHYKHLKNLHTLCINYSNSTRTKEPSSRQVHAGLHMRDWEPSGPCDVNCYLFVLHFQSCPSLELPNWFVENLKVLAKAIYKNLQIWIRVHQLNWM